MQATANRYSRLSNAYVKLSEQFHELDVAHMNLKQKILPAIKTIKAYQALTMRLKQQKMALERELEALRSSQVELMEMLASQKEQGAQLSATIETLGAEKASLEAQLLALEAKYEAIAEFEVLMQPDPEAMLMVAEQQMELVEATLHEMAANSDPDLSEAEKQLIEIYQCEFEDFTKLLEEDGAEPVTVEQLAVAV
jgi:chromosome segregation ATPase